MHRLRVVFLGLMVVVIFGIAVAIAGQDKKESKQAEATEAEDTLCIPLGSFLIEPPESVEPKRSAVMFSHSKHFYWCRFLSKCKKQFRARKFSQCRTKRSFPESFN